MSKVDHVTSYKDTCDSIQEAAYEEAHTSNKSDKSWFDYKKDILMTEMSKQDILLSKTKWKDLPPIKRDLRKEELRELDGWIDNPQRVAEESLAQDHAERIHSMDFNPGFTWRSVEILAKGQSPHHKKHKTMAFRRSDGGLAQNDEEQMEVLEAHFSKGI